MLECENVKIENGKMGKWDLSPISQGGSMEWTNEQKQAIFEKGENILVAAAARKWQDGCACGANYQ